MGKQSKDKSELNNMTLDEMRGFFLSIGEKPFRASQVFRWMYKSQTTETSNTDAQSKHRFYDQGSLSSFDHMTNVPKELRELLSQLALIHTLTVEEVNTSTLDGAQKFLLGTTDGYFIESVLMKYESWNTVCVSSQVGCKMKCAFCASGAVGFRRNLNAGEMLDQLTLTRQYTGESVNHVVIMGVGEPLDNLEQVERFVRILEEPDGLHMGRRNITVSTCGLIPGIRKIADILPQVNLAISLHAPDDELRSELMPVNDTYKIADLLVALRGHIAKTGRRATIEYALIKGVNDSPDCARRLAARLKGINCHVNLIQLNDTGMGYSGSNKTAADLFKLILDEAGIQVTNRRSMGRDIHGACGQLRLLAEKVKL
jgi:23S rRNA (adenine2503-C2)-methyltransferase